MSQQLADIGIDEDKKIQEIIREEEENESVKIISKLKKEKIFDFEAYELFIRTEVLRFGGNVLERFIQEMVEKLKKDRVICECGGYLCNIGTRTKRIKTVLGEIEYSRPLYHCNNLIDIYFISTEYWECLKPLVRPLKD